MFGLALLCGITSVVLLDTIGSLFVRGNVRRYAALAPISYIVWFTTGAIAGRLSHSDPALAFAQSAFAAGLVGFADATIGWWISTVLGATPMSAGQTWASRIGRVSARVAARAAVLGAIGGAVAAIY